MKTTASLIIMILLMSCSNGGKSKVVIEALDFAEIYKDKEGVVLLRFKTLKPFVFYSNIDAVTVISSNSIQGVNTPYVTYTPNGSNQITGILIELGSQEKVYRWRNAIKQGEPIVLYPSFEFKEDEKKN